MGCSSPYECLGGGWSRGPSGLRASHPKDILQEMDHPRKAPHPTIANTLRIFALHSRLEIEPTYIDADEFDLILVVHIKTTPSWQNIQHGSDKYVSSFMHVNSDVVGSWQVSEILHLVAYN